MIPFKRSSFFKLVWQVVIATYLGSLEIKLHCMPPWHEARLKRKKYVRVEPFLEVQMAGARLCMPQQDFLAGTTLQTLEIQTLLMHS